MPRYASHRSPRSVLGARAGAPAPALRASPQPSQPTPRSLREFKRTQKRLMEERLRRRDHALARRLGLLPPPPPSRPRLPKPQPIAITREQVAKQARQRALHAVWDDMAQTGQDRLDLSPRTSPPTWSDPPRLKSPADPIRAARSSGSRSAGTPVGQAAFPASQPLPAPRRSYVAGDAEREEMDAVIAGERAKLDVRVKIDNAVTAFRSRLSAQQWRAGWGEGIADESIALHERLFAWRRYRSG